MKKPWIFLFGYLSGIASVYIYKNYIRNKFNDMMVDNDEDLNDDELNEENSSKYHLKNSFVVKSNEWDNVLKKFDEIIKTNGFITVSDVREYFNEETYQNDNEIGWTSTGRVNIVTLNSEFNDDISIEFPYPHKIELLKENKKTIEMVKKDYISDNYKTESDIPIHMIVSEEDFDDRDSEYDTAILTCLSTGDIFDDAGKILNMKDVVKRLGNDISNDLVCHTYEFFHYHDVIYVENNRDKIYYVLTFDLRTIDKFYEDNPYIKKINSED